MNRFLISTALEESWRDDVPVLFLGEWCQIHARKSRWSRMDARVVPYHWDDRSKLIADYRHLQDVYEHLLNDLAIRLNQVHGAHHGIRYWRILVGPWLGYFVQMLFDRWESVRQVAHEHPCTETIVLKISESDMIPNDMDDFNRLFISDDWNHFIYASILAQTPEVRCIPGPPRRTPAFLWPPQNASWRCRARRALAAWISRWSHALSNEQDSLLLSTYLAPLDLLALCWRLGQVPALRRSVPPQRIRPDANQRRWDMPGVGRSEFESYARSMIPRQLPTTYLEGYSGLLRSAADRPWPKRPKLIWTSIAHNFDEVFKAYAADKAEAGTPLVIGQHGGHDGTGLFSFTEEHDIAISNGFLSWGWTDSRRPKVAPIGIFKSKPPLGVHHARQPHALLVTTAVPRQSYHLFSIMVSGQWLDYFKDHCAFVDNLPAHIRQALIIRLYHQDYGWDQVSRWRESFPDVRVDPGHASMDYWLRRTRLYIATYNATTFLESFSMDIPTMIYWNPAHSELRDSAIPYFEGLKRVGIFHETPEAAARQAALVWDDIDAWWNSPALRRELAAFKDRYCHHPENLLDRLELALRRIAAEPRQTTLSDIH